jgi:hypothetical protein
VKNVLVCSLLVAGVISAVPAASEYLVSINLATPEQVYDLGSRNVRVVAQLEDACLALLRTDEFPLLGSEFAARILDAEPGDRLYVLVVPKRGRDLNRASLPGTALFDDGRVVLIRATEDDIPDLNRLPVELTRLALEPMVLTGSDAGPLPEPRPLSDSLVTAIVATVSQDSVLGFIRRLQNFRTRYSTTDSCRNAVNYMVGRLQDYRCDSFYGHTYNSSYAPNAVGVKVGRTNPRRQYIICGHIDATSDHEPDWCPGSDDNASGTTVALEAARVFADYDFDYTVKFIGFSGEEQGLYGSDSFSRQASRRHDTILGVLNFDMISYGRTNRDSLIITGRSVNPNCTPLVNAYCANADTYTTLKFRKDMISSGGYGSDHYYFWQRGYLALWGMENDFTPMYHTIGDTIAAPGYVNCGTNNIPMCTEGIRAAVATVAKLAGAHILSGIEQEAAAARRFELSQNSPNPFAGQTVIRYSPGSDASARVRIYDLRGALVNELADPGTVGVHQVSWNGRDWNGRPVVPGVYFYRLEGNSQTPFRKAVLTQ